MSDREESSQWWISLSIDDRIFICEKYYPNWKWRMIFKSGNLIEKIWKLEIKNK